MAVAVLLGGRSLLGTMARVGTPAAVVLGALAVTQVVMALRGRARLGQAAGLWLARDVAFLAATAAALTFVLLPARWSGGAAIAACEFGLLLEFFNCLT